MISELLPYYERELLFVRKMASEFAQLYPDRAGALRIGRNGCDDPHVERLIESFALIAGRIQRKIDEEFPEITQALLDLLYPHYVQPVPPMAIAQFQVDPDQSKSPTGYSVARGASAFSESTASFQCRFRTAYSSRLWPLKVLSAEFARSVTLQTMGSGPESPYAFRIEVQVQGQAKLSALQIDELRFYIGGDQQAAHWIYELLFNNVARALVRYTDRNGKRQSFALPPHSIREVGFSRDEAALPYSARSFQGYRLLKEYFCFPNKFLFFDLLNLGQLRSSGVTDRFEIVILLSDFQRNERANLLEASVNADNFQLGCVPIVNLFEQCAEPIRLSHTKTEYPVLPEVHAAAPMEIYSVDRVTSVARYAEQPVEYQPFYSLHHGSTQGERQCFWYATRRADEHNSSSTTRLYISFVDDGFRTSSPATESITAHVTCSNSEGVAHLAINGKWGELELESAPLIKSRIVYGPTKPIRAHLGRALQWRLISHLGLNHLSIADGGAPALREILRLYNPGKNPAIDHQIDGVTSVRSGRKMARLDSEYGLVFCQGISIDAEFDEDQFAGSSAYLLATVLERFFGLYCAVNSFTQLRATTKQRKGIIWEWPPRAGEQAIA